MYSNCLCAVNAYAHIHIDTHAHVHRVDKSKLQTQTAIPELRFQAHAIQDTRFKHAQLDDAGFGRLKKTD